MTREKIAQLVAKISEGIIFSSSILLVMANSAQALTAGISDFTGGFQQSNPLSNGFRFQATQNLNVTALGVYDVNENGLGASIVDVGLWDDTGTLLGEVDVLAGTAAPIQNGFRYQTLTTSINLTTGNFYRVAAYSVDFEPHIAFATPATLNGIDSVQGFSNTAPGLSFPSNSSGGSLLAGGNIFFEDAIPVPFEVSPNLGILILGGILVASRLRKKSNS